MPTVHSYKPSLLESSEWLDTTAKDSGLLKKEALPELWDLVQQEAKRLKQPIPQMIEILTASDVVFTENQQNTTRLILGENLLHRYGIVTESATQNPEYHPEHVERLRYPIGMALQNTRRHDIQDAAAGAGAGLAMFTVFFSGVKTLVDWGLRKEDGSYRGGWLGQTISYLLSGTAGATAALQGQQWAREHMLERRDNAASPNNNDKFHAANHLTSRHVITDDQRLNDEQDPSLWDRISQGFSDLFRWGDAMPRATHLRSASGIVFNDKTAIMSGDDLRVEAKAKTLSDALAKEQLSDLHITVQSALDGTARDMIPEKATASRKALENYITAVTAREASSSQAQNSERIA